MRGIRIPNYTFVVDVESLEKPFEFSVGNVLGAEHPIAIEGLFPEILLGGEAYGVEPGGPYLRRDVAGALRIKFGEEDGH